MDLVSARRFIAAVPEGCWTAYKDVAIAAGNSRVGDRGRKPGRTGLRREGVWVEANGRVRQRQRFTADDWVGSGGVA